METFCTEKLINDVIVGLNENGCKNIFVVRTNNESFSTYGELYLSPHHEMWKTFFTQILSSDKNPLNIMQYFSHAYHGKARDDVDVKHLLEKILQALVVTSYDWAIKLEKCAIRENRICLHLNRLFLITNVIKTAIESGDDFGRNLMVIAPFEFEISSDESSELTTKRLQLIKSITERLLTLNGRTNTDEINCYKYLFTTKSQGKLEQGYKRYLCGVVQNSNSNAKETSLTWKDYIKRKIDQLRLENECKTLSDFHEQDTKKENFFNDLAQAIGKFELMSIKPNRPVLIGDELKPQKSISNTKGASFVLYNDARVSAIRTKYNKKITDDVYPVLPSIQNVDFSLLELEDEWELIYNYIFGYPQMLKNCLKLDTEFQTSPQLICFFLAGLCRKFSVYYRKTKILMEGQPDLIPKVIARIYMLQALQIVLQNALAIFDITPMSRM